MKNKFQIVDCHLHLIDDQHNEYAHFKKVDPGFVALVGDYSELPRKYLVEDYLKDTKGFPVVKTVMAEFVSQDPLKEAKWAQHLADRFGHPHGFIASVDPLNPQFESLLEQYKEIPNVRAVRQHLLWHPHNELMRFAKRPGLLQDKEWRKNFAKLQKYDFVWEFEIFAHQIPEAEDLANAFPDIKMILHPMGWPLDHTSAGFDAWEKNMRAISSCDNLAVKITAIGCIFPNWTLEKIRPWIRETVEIFGPKRSMFGSHMPIEKLDKHSFAQLYAAYKEIVKDLSADEQRSVFSDTAIDWYRL